MRHWAFDLIGVPWSPDGQGPESFSCWGLVRHVFRHRFGIEMPLVRIDGDTDENVGAIKRAAEASGFRRTSQPAEDGDIVLLRGIDGRHVGVVAATSTGLVLLHSEGWQTPHGNVGGVVAQPLAVVLGSGAYAQPELWRPG